MKAEVLAYSPTPLKPQRIELQTRLLAHKPIHEALRTCGSYASYGTIDAHHESTTTSHGVSVCRVCGAKW